MVMIPMAGQLVFSWNGGGEGEDNNQGVPNCTLAKSADVVNPDIFVGGKY